MKKTLLFLLLTISFLMVLGLCAAYAETGISVSGVHISNGYGSDVNHDKATVALSGNTITVSGVLDDMESYLSASPGQGEGKWVGILITTNQDSITSLYYSSDGTSYSQLTEADIDEAVQMGAGLTDDSTFILWVKANVVATADKIFYLADNAGGTDPVSYTVEFVDQVTVTTNLTHMTSSNAATRTDKNEAYSTTLSPTSGYSLPSVITVTVGGTTLTGGTKYTYSPSTGALSIPADKVTGAIVISGVGEFKAISVTGVAISDGDSNHDKATVALSGSTITVSGVLGDMVSYTSASPGQGSGKWVGILITTNRDSITDLWYKSTGAYSQLTQADIDEAVQMGASGTRTFILWIKADVVKDAAKTIYLASSVAGDNTVSYTVQVVDQVTVNTSLTNMTSSNTAERVTKGTAYSTTLHAASGYSLPAAITVTVGGSTMTSGYTYSQSTGAFSIPAGNVTGNIVISGAGVAEESWAVDMKILGDDEETYLGKDDFTPDDTSYSLDLDDEVEELSLYVYFDDNDYNVTVKYDGSKVSRDDYTSSYYLYKFDVDTDDLGKLTVKVADIDDSSDYVTYTFTLDGSSSGSDALEDIHLNTGTSYKTSSSYGVDLYPGFDSDITDYVALLPYDDDYDDAVDLYLRLTLEDDDVDLVYEGSDVTLSSDYYNDTLSVDAGDYEVINFTVEDVDYTITVYYAAKSADDDAYLDDLNIRSKHTTSSSYDLDLSPKFDEDESEYSLDPGDYKTLYVYPEADSDMIVLVEGEYLTSDYWSFDPDDYDEITVTVFAENLEDYEEYTIDLDGTSNSLTSLSVYSGTYSSVKLSPSFSSSVYNYVGSVENSVSSVTLKFSSSSTVKIAKDSGTYVTKSSGAVYSLNEGLNEFDIQVGSTHYYLNIYRESATLTIAPSTQYISINGGSKIAIPAFNINGNNFVKLRAVAYLLSGTGKQFSVNYADASKLITLRSGYGYASVGGELTIPTSYTKAVASSQTLYLNSSYIYPTAYNIDGYNYFLLRDLAALLDFQIKYSGNTVYIYTDKTYGGESSSSSSSSSDFEIGMKLMGDSDTYLSKSDFDPDDNSYDVEINEDEETLDLYVYFDSDDYTVKVKYDGTTVGKDGSTSSYYVYGIDVDTEDLDEITVTVTNDDGDKEVYTIYLDVE